MTFGFIYIITNKNNTTLYTGVTSNLSKRIIEHKTKKYSKSFSVRYNLEKLVYYECYQMIGDAITREKKIKAGSRRDKINLIQKSNPNWLDLFKEIENIMSRN
ncbi:GIY-YIG nuclease family protein [Flavobacterium sp. H122]|uniref:GIY-YIG nuclease family protein n=1 Tax=Flavobacterium sp. H122 TaxID=2529860 RepID=UPI0010AA60AB|nr:GIY-YIG nuclease family protein [Flavobacterium sp. H122]